MGKKQLRIPDLLKKKAAGEKSVMVTAYDYFSAALADESGVDMILVGDSLGNAVLGYETTIPVTLEDIIHHTRPVVRGAKRAIIIADMPFGSYQISRQGAVESAVRLVKEGGASCVKLEGGTEIIPVIKDIIAAGIPVMGHIGLLPQTAPLWDGYHARGRQAAEARQLLETAQALDEAGVFGMVLECIAKEAAALITQNIKGLTIGIGSGAACDGQVLVGQDLYGQNTGHIPSFVKQFGNVAEEMGKAFRDYAQEVREGSYPNDKHSFFMLEGEAEKLK